MMPFRIQRKSHKDITASGNAGEKFVDPTGEGTSPTATGHGIVTCIGFLDVLENIWHHEHMSI
jgi:hypothetical protein